MTMNVKEKIESYLRFKTTGFDHIEKVILQGFSSQGVIKPRILSKNECCELAKSISKHYGKEYLYNQWLRSMNEWGEFEKDITQIDMSNKTGNIKIYAHVVLLDNIQYAVFTKKNKEKYSYHIQPFNYFDFS
jgi:hypothetical protein